MLKTIIYRTNSAIGRGIRGRENVRVQWNRNSERFYHEAGDDMGYMEDTGNHDVRTEGMNKDNCMALLDWLACA